MTGVLVYDGDCGFCTTSARLAGRIVTSARVVPWQRADLTALGVRPEDAAAAVQWVDATGQVSSGAVAVARMLQNGRLLWRLLGTVLLLPGVRSIAARLYRLVAANRQHLPGGTPACRMD
jgi:predicted DCC family thiol-disulfide oxidoreductase YuxK